MNLHDLGDESALAAATAVGAAIGKLIDLFVMRMRGKAAETPAIIKAGAEMQQAVTEAAKELLEDYRNQLEFVRKRHNDLQAEVDQARSDVALARKDHASCRTELERLQGELDELKAQTSLFSERG